MHAEVEPFPPVNPAVTCSRLGMKAGIDVCALQGPNSTSPRPVTRTPPPYHVTAALQLDTAASKRHCLQQLRCRVSRPTSPPTSLHWMIATGAASDGGEDECTCSHHRTFRRPFCSTVGPELDLAAVKRGNPLTSSSQFQPHFFLTSYLYVFYSLLCRVFAKFADPSLPKRDFLREFAEFPVPICLPTLIFHVHCLKTQAIDKISPSSGTRG